MTPRGSYGKRTPPDGNQNVDVKYRAEEFDQQAATKILTGLKATVGGNTGVVKLMHTTDPTQHMTFEVKSRHQFIELSGSDMKDTSGYLRVLFRQALEGCNEKIKTEFLSDIDSYLQEHDNRFGSETLLKFVTRLEDIQSKPRTVEERYTWPDPEMKLLEHNYEVKPWNFQDGDLTTGEVVFGRKLGDGAFADVYTAEVPLTNPGDPFPRHLDRALKVIATDKCYFYPVNILSGMPDPVTGEPAPPEISPTTFPSCARAIMPPAVSRAGRASSVRNITT